MYKYKQLVPAGCVLYVDYCLLRYAGRQYDAVKIDCPCIWHDGFQRHGGRAVLIVDEFDIQVTVLHDKFLTIKPN